MNEDHGPVLLALARTSIASGFGVKIARVTDLNERDGGYTLAHGQGFGVQTASDSSDGAEPMSVEGQKPTLATR